MRFGVRSRLYAPAHLAGNPELPLKTNRLEIEDNTNLVANGHNSQPILQQSEDEQPILRHLQKQTLKTIQALSRVSK